LIGWNPCMNHIQLQEYWFWWMKNDPNRWKFSLLMNDTIGWTFMMFWDEFNFIHGLWSKVLFRPWIGLEFIHTSLQVYEWKFIYSSSGIHGQNKSLDNIPWMKLNSFWNTMNSLPIISFMNYENSQLVGSFLNHQN